MLQTDTRDHTESGEHLEAAAVVTASTVSPAVSEARRDLYFQRCLWCRTPDYRRSFCRACGSRAFSRERSAGAGVTVRRNGHVHHNTWFVAMDDGFNLLCQVSGTAPLVVGVGARVTVVQAVAPFAQGLPVVEVTYPARHLARW